MTTTDPIRLGDLVTRADRPGTTCRVTRIYPDGDLARFEVVRRDGGRDGRWRATGGFTGSLRNWTKLEG